ncbi:hypothetical protein D9M68_161520 [compost metagenome]
MKFEHIDYRALNSRQKENYNFQKISAVLADYGFVTLRLSDDWQGADFIAHHIRGDRFLKVQLKGRLTVDTKYKNKDIWIGFTHAGRWYLYPHDAFLKWALANLNIGNTKDWQHLDDWLNLQGVYSWPAPNKRILAWLQDYALQESPACSL